jgi:peptide/nickel transport system ATP-binding protein
MGDRELLRVENLCIDYVGRDKDVRAVDRVSFSIREGEVFGLAGESGSGKSTIIQGILRLLGPPAIITGGRVLFRGRDILDLDEEGLRQVRWQKISLVCQSAMNALNPVLTVGEQICDVIEVHQGVSSRRARRRAGELLELVGIETTRLDSYPHELSGGMRQRVVIAIALALDPPLLFMDEPTTALDVVVQKEILKTIAELKRELEFSILFITHDLSLMLEFCTHVGILYAGRLVECAPAQDLFARPRHPYTRGLMRSFPDVRGEETWLEGIPGSPPDLQDPPPGCRFHPRCDAVIDQCRIERPKLVQLDVEHVAACHREQ